MLGENHPDYATTLNNLAELYRNMGQYEKAEPLYSQALEIRKRVLGEGHPDYALSLNNLAELYKDMGQYEKAEPLYLQALEIRKRVLGETHPDYAMPYQIWHACSQRLVAMPKLWMFSLRPFRLNKTTSSRSSALRPRQA